MPHTLAEQSLPGEGTCITSILIDFWGTSPFYDWEEGSPAKGRDLLPSHIYAQPRRGQASDSSIQIPSFRLFQPSPLPLFWALEWILTLQQFIWEPLDICFIQNYTVKLEDVYGSPSHLSFISITHLFNHWFNYSINSSRTYFVLCMVLGVRDPAWIRQGLRSYGAHKHSSLFLRRSPALGHQSWSSRVSLWPSTSSPNQTQNSASPTWPLGPDPLPHCPYGLHPLSEPSP